MANVAKVAIKRVYDKSSDEVVRTALDNVMKGMSDNGPNPTPGASSGTSKTGVGRSRRGMSWKNRDWSGTAGSAIRKARLDAREKIRAAKVERKTAMKSARSTARQARIEAFRKRRLSRAKPSTPETS